MPAGRRRWSLAMLIAHSPIGFLTDTKDRTLREDAIQKPSNTILPRDLPLSIKACARFRLVALIPPK